MRASTQATGHVHGDVSNKPGFSPPPQTTHKQMPNAKYQRKPASIQATDISGSFFWVSDLFMGMARANQDAHLLLKRPERRTIAM